MPGVISEKARMVGAARTIIMTWLLLLMSTMEASAADTRYKSFHFGFMDPNGVDLVGYTVEKPITVNVYRFYTFGIPSLAAIGLSYYDDYHGNGLTSTVGVGIGSVLYGSIAFQLRLAKMQYLKIGAGLTAGIAYSGAYPVLAYEKRF